MGLPSAMIVGVSQATESTRRPGPAEVAINAAMRRLQWDHNAHYHRTLLRRIPRRFGRGLDVGCGKGAFARRLARRAGAVDAVDVAPDIVAVARSRTPAVANVRFLVGDVLDPSLHLAGYDVITGLAVIHHMPLGPALDRLHDLLLPGGVLLVLGCYEEETRSDVIVSRTASLANIAMGLAHRIGRTANRRSAVGPGAPVAPPTMTLAEIRSQVEARLPGATIHRRLFWRYLLTYRRPR